VEDGKTINWGGGGCLPATPSWGIVDRRRRCGEWGATHKRGEERAAHGIKEVCPEGHKARVIMGSSWTAPWVPLEKMVEDKRKEVA